jgi:hypothetical protein
VSRTVTTQGQKSGTQDAPDWDALFPADPELMASAEGDTRGLAELKRAARERIQRLEQA